MVLLKRLGKDSGDVALAFLLVWLSIDLIGMVFDHYFPENGIASFFEGMLLGVTMMLVVTGLYYYGRSLRESRDSSKKDTGDQFD
ncbi:MAG: hypothetical protein ACFE85_06265 [Candidatus Hodarchaeota archaeon]